ncbi:ATP-binding protein [Pantoea sp.]|uniref:ATP-binding protein n=1 Tax=Pantoea sp. TaxID=69393 RepID=UPI0028A9EEF1|nr:ATP-binding protein [Pantoea sp.]
MRHQLTTGRSGCARHRVGHGIEPSYQERIFDRFYRADPSRKDSVNSSRLGLSIVSSIMQLHARSCWVESREGVTCFGLLFPISL